MKELPGSDFFDDQGVFEEYLKKRSWSQNPNQLMEYPAVLELTKEIQGNVLDIGCGYGDIVTHLLDRKISQYVGIDSSTRMIALATSKHKDKRVSFIHSSVEGWEFERSKFDWVLSRLVFHYVADLKKIMIEIYRSLKENGKLVFSVEHPVITSSMHLSENVGRKQDWKVDQYFEVGERIQEWMGKRVIKYHRTVEEYCRVIKQSGFIIESIKEGCPQRDDFLTTGEYERRKRIPVFLIFRVTK